MIDKAPHAAPSSVTTGTHSVGSISAAGSGMNSELERLLEEFRWLKRVTEDDTENLYGRTIAFLEAMSLTPQVSRVVTEAMIEMGHYAACLFANGPTATMETVKRDYPFDQLDQRRKDGMRAVYLAMSKAPPANEAIVLALKAADDFICDLAGDTPMMDYCQANPEAEFALLKIRAALSLVGGE